MESKMRVFLAYCSNDKGMYVRFHAPLKSLFDKQYMHCWIGYEIRQGQEIDEDIKRSMEVSEVLLLFISPDFLATEL